MKSLDKMVEELVQQKLQKIAEEMATRIVEEQLGAATSGKRSVSNKPHQRHNRYSMNPIVDFNHEANNLEKPDTISFKIFNATKEILEFGPTTRVKLCRILMLKLNLSMGHVSRTLTDFLDKKYLKVVT